MTHEPKDALTVQDFIVDAPNEASRCTGCGMLYRSSLCRWACRPVPNFNPDEYVEQVRHYDVPRVEHECGHMCRHLVAAGDGKTICELVGNFVTEQVPDDFVSGMMAIAVCSSIIERVYRANGKLYSQSLTLRRGPHGWQRFNGFGTWVDLDLITNEEGRIRWGTPWPKK